MVKVQGSYEIVMGSCTRWKATRWVRLHFSEDGEGQKIVQRFFVSYWIGDSILKKKEATLMIKLTWEEKEICTSCLVDG